MVDMKEQDIWEPLAVKLQTYRTAVERTVLLLRTDDIISGDDQDTGQERVVGRRPQLRASSPSAPTPTPADCLDPVGVCVWKGPGRETAPGRFCPSSVCKRH